MDSTIQNTAHLSPGEGRPENHSPPDNRAKSIVDMIIVLVGKFSTVAVVLLGGMFTARLGGEAQYGIFVAALTTAVLISTVLGNALDIAVIHFATRQDATEAQTHRFHALAFHLRWIGTGVLVAIYGLLWLAGLRPPADFPVVATLLATLSLLLARSVALGVQVQKRFGLYAMLDFIQGVGRTGLFLGFAAASVGHAAVYIGSYASTGFAIVLVGMFFLKQDFLRDVRFSLQEAHRLMTFAGVSAIAIGCGAVTGRADVLFLYFSQGSDAFADYGVASQITQLPSQVALYLSVVTQPRILEDARAGRAWKLFGIAGLVMLGGAAVSLVLWHFGFFHFAIHLLFGESYLGATRFLPVLFTGGILDLLLIPIPLTLAMLAVPRTAAVSEAVFMALFVLSGFVIIAANDGVAAQVAMAWSFTAVRAAKLLFYGGLVWLITQKRNHAF